MIRCPARLDVPEERDNFQCELRVSHECQHRNGARYWSAPLSEHEQSIVERAQKLEAEASNTARASLERRTILRAETEEACLYAAKIGAEAVKMIGEPGASIKSSPDLLNVANATKALVEAALLLRGA